MSTEVTIRFRDDGPIVVEGPVELVDVDGRPIAVESNKPNLALCRCGASRNKPFCDGTHRTSGFQSVIRAGEP
jgi:CDGSH iron-sulfur domain-containing protein 3